jgi:hypothetical protein
MGHHEAQRPAEDLRHLGSGGSLRSVRGRLEFHYVPKHASWLNEIEIGVLEAHCPDRRSADKATLVRENASWQRAQRITGARVLDVHRREGAREDGARLPAGPAPAASEAA